MRSLLLALLIAAPALAPAQTLDVARSRVDFVIRNAGFNVDGEVTQLAGTVRFDTANPAATQLDVTAPIAHLRTGITSRDEHLRKPDYFDAAKHPNMRFQSTRVTRQADGSYLAQGNLTIKGTTKAVQLPFTVQTEGDRQVLTSRFQLNRRDYGVGGSSWVMSDEVRVTVRLVLQP